MNAPEKGMRRDDVRRYCLPCSEETGRLVLRVCAAAEKAKTLQQERRKSRAKRRTKKTAALRRRATKAKRESKSAALRRKRANAKFALERLERPDKDYLFSGIDLAEQLDRLLLLPSIPGHLRHLKPVLHVRQCDRPVKKWGFATFRNGRGYISVSLWSGIGPGQMLGHLCHELAHLVAWHECVARKPHGPEWRRAYVALAKEGYSVRVGTPVGPHRNDLDVEIAIALSPVGREMMRRAKEAS